MESGGRRTLSRDLGHLPNMSVNTHLPAPQALQELGGLGVVEAHV